MEDVLVIRAARTLPWLRRSMFGMYRWVPAGFVLLGALVIAVALSVSTHGPSLVLDWVPFLVFVCVLVLWMIPRHLRLARKLYLMSEISGPPVFTVTPTRIRCEHDGNTSDLSWSSIHSICVSSRTLYVFVNRHCAWFIPRGGQQDQLLATAQAAGVRIRGRPRAR